MIAYNVTFGDEESVRAVDDFESIDEVCEFINEALIEHGEGEKEGDGHTCRTQPAGRRHREQRAQSHGRILQHYADPSPCQYRGNDFPRASSVTR